MTSHADGRRRNDTRTRVRAYAHAVCAAQASTTPRIITQRERVKQVSVITASSEAESQPRPSGCVWRGMSKR
eukprot:2491462-Pleurochrysis_carterae.AAC.3